MCKSPELLDYFNSKEITTKLSSFLRYFQDSRSSREQRSPQRGRVGSELWDLRSGERVVEVVGSRINLTKSPPNCFKSLLSSVQVTEVFLGSQGGIRMQTGWGDRLEQFLLYFSYGKGGQ